MPTGKGALRIAVEDFLSGFGFGDKFHAWTKHQLEIWEQEGLDTYEKILDFIGIKEQIPEQFSPQRLRGLVGHQIELLLIIAPILLNIITEFTQGFFAPVLRPISRLSEGLFKTKHPDIGTLAQMKRKFPEGNFNYEILMAEEGYSSQFQKAFDRLTQQFLTALDYERLKLRGQLSDSELHARLKILGYEDQEINGLAELTRIIPTPNDLITMQVREAFNDEFSARFRHDEGDTSQVTLWAEKQGLSAEWVKRYWRAHWQLPSPQQVFEMLHRLRPNTSENTITADDVDGYLKAADYSPFWRERLKEISYNPYTRVDIRRMYKTGILNEVEVKEAYLDLGYDDKHAQALTDFTIAYEVEEETGIVRSSVISAYGDGQIDRTTAESMLANGGYDGVTIAFYLDNMDFKQGLEVQNIKIQNIKRKFIEGLLDESTVHSQLNALNLPAERLTALLELWLTERENQTALLSVSQMELLLERGIVSPDDFKRVVKRRGYTDESLQWTMTRIAQEAAEKAQRDAEKLAADHERIQKSKTASQYQKDKSGFDLAIAQARAEITDIDVALSAELSADDITTLKARKDKLKQFIARLNVSKAQLQFDTQSALNKLVG